ncbi:hypothetical protein CAEBREN_01780 [Caenorhabditis brenneri]|uniref:Uncharacterized protein n=1 Tax=Caenorhabditis brenneri TaxID=135651 RepID=G0MXD3_CAEBE|nr:hypothetical protein CAEBREN_01780 [Caenorhabditis brenneri]
MVIMRVFATAQSGSSRLTHRISTQLALLSNEITLVYQSAMTQVRTFARRRNSRSDRSMDTSFSYLSTFQQSTSHNKKKSDQLVSEVTHPVLARKALGFGTSPLLLHNDTVIPTLPDETDKRFQEKTDVNVKPSEICWRADKPDSTALINDDITPIRESQIEYQAKRAGRLDLDSLLRISELSSYTPSVDNAPVLPTPKMDVAEKPVEICWRVVKTDTTTLATDEKIPIQKSQAENQDKRAGRLDVDNLLRASELSATEKALTANNEPELTDLRMEIELNEKNRTKFQKKTLRRRAEKYEEVKDDLKSEIKRCSKIFDDVPENSAMERFDRTKKRANAADRKWLCDKIASKSPKAKNSSSKVSSPPSNKVAMPPFNQDSSPSPTNYQEKEECTPAVETPNVGVTSTFSITIGDENASQSKDGVRVRPASGVQSIVVINQDAAHQSALNNQVNTGSTITNGNSPLIFPVAECKEPITPEKQNVVESNSKVTPGSLQSPLSAPKKTDASGSGCEKFPHSSSMKSAKKLSATKNLANLIIPTGNDCNNNYTEH